MYVFLLSKDATQRLWISLAYVIASLMPIASLGSNADWTGPAGVAGGWFDAFNWQDGLIANDNGLYTWIGNLGVARLASGQDASVRELYIGANSSWTALNGHLSIDHAILRSRVIHLYNTSSLSLNNATLLQSNPQWDIAPSITSYSNASAGIDFVSGSYSLHDISHQATGAVTVADAVVLDVDSLRVGGDSSHATWTQNGDSTISMNSLSVGGRLGGTAQYRLNAGQLTASEVSAGRNYNLAFPEYDGTGAIDQYGGSFEVGLMSLADLGRYNQYGGTLHVEDALSGTGTLDFTGQNGALSFGSQAQFNLRDLTILNAGSTAVSGGDNGVIYVAAGFDPSAVFGSFNFGGLVIKEGAPIHIQSDQDIVLSGTIGAQLLIEGSLFGDGGPLFLQGPTTIRGTVDISSDNFSQALVVDGHTSKMESGYGRFEAIVGDGATNSRLELLGGDFAGSFLIARGVGGGTVDVLIDGTDTTGENLQISVFGDGTNGGRASVTHSSGTVNATNIWVGDSVDTFAIYSRAGLNYPSSTARQSDNSYTLSGDAVININERFGVNWNTVGIGWIESDGHFVQVGGTFNAQNAQVWLGRGDGITGRYDMDAGYLRAAEMLIGFQGIGRFIQDGGSVVVDGEILLGNTRSGFLSDFETGEDYFVGGGDGLYQINAGSLAAGTISVSKAGFGVFEQNDGSVHTGFLNVGENTQPSGLAEYRLTSGALSADRVRLGRSTIYRGKLVQTGGTADLGRLEINQYGTYLLFGGTTNLHGSLILNNGDIDFSDGDATFHVADGGFANFIGGNILGGANATLTGDTNSVISFEVGFDTSQFGTFATEGLVHFGGDELVIPFGRLIAAAGSFNGSIVNNGVLAPGSSPGTLTVNGNLVQGDTADLKIELGGTDATDYDRVQVTGSATLRGNLSISFYDGFIPHEDDIFGFLYSTSVSGMFENVENGRVFMPGGSFAISYSENNDTLWLFDYIAIPGDLNGDGALDNDDISPFIQALIDPTNYASSYSTLNPDDLGDFNDDGVLDNLDIFGFVTALTGGEELSAEQVMLFEEANLQYVPEPGSLAVLGVGGLIIIRRRRDAG